MEQITKFNRKSERNNHDLYLVELGSIVLREATKYKESIKL